MCSIFHNTITNIIIIIQAVFKFQSPYFDWATDPILQFFSTKTHLQDYTSQTPGNTPSVHTHGNFNPRAQSHHHTNSTSVRLSENLSYEFIIISVFSSSIWTMSLTIIFSGRKQPCILHLLLFPDEAAALSLSSLSPSSTSAHLRSFYFVPHASSDVQRCLSSSLLQR